METVLVPLLTNKEVAKVLGCGWRCVDRLRLSGELPYVQLGRFFRYRATDVQAFIDAGGTVQRNGGEY